MPMENHRLDLHGVRHYAVDRHVENFVLLNQHLTPLTIICGNSQRMIDLVSMTLTRLCIREFAMDRYGVFIVYRV